MNVSTIGFASGCAIDQYRGLSDNFGRVEYDIFRIGNTLYARCKEGDHRTLSSDLKVINLYNEIRDHWRRYKKEKGYDVLDCPKPKGIRQKKELINAKISRTNKLRHELKKSGVI